MRKLTNEESNRWIEIEFYYLIKHTLKHYHNNVFIYDIIESICALFEVNTTLIKASVNSIIKQNSVLEPTKREVCILWSRKSNKVRLLKRYANIHPTTYQRHTSIEDIDDYDYFPKLHPKHLEELKKFNQGVQQLSKLWQRI
jgi:hypothetical protein